MLLGTPLYLTLRQPTAPDELSRMMAQDQVIAVVAQVFSLAMPLLFAVLLILLIMLAWRIFRFLGVATKQKMLELNNSERTTTPTGESS
jgi:membrane protein implicated in regulation of membrane protease activity